jgi:hypothetical protein
MSDDKGKKIVVIMNSSDTESLEKEATNARMPLATFVRSIIVEHLRKQSGDSR